MGAQDASLSWHPEILHAEQRTVLGQLGRHMTAREFYLAGGTGVALRLGHRQSVDLDWFTGEWIQDPLRLAAEMRDEGLAFQTAQVDRGTLHGAISGVRVSLLEYRYPLLQPWDVWPECGCAVASLDDLASMKLSAIAQRGSRKDFVDLYALGLRHGSLAQMLELYGRRYSVEDIAHVLYSLSYFDDADREPMPSMLWEVDWESAKQAIQGWVRRIAGA